MEGAFLLHSCSINRSMLMTGMALLLACSLLNAADAVEMDEHYMEEPEFGASVYVVEAGKEHRDSVVLVHGLGDAGSDDWSKVIPLLSKRYHVTAVDLPGFAKSEKGNHLYSPTRYANFLKWVVDRYSAYKDKRPVFMVGHSMGGAIVLRYASMYPETLKKVVLVDAAGILHRTAFMTSSVRHVSKMQRLKDMLGSSPKDLGKWLGDVIISSEKIKLPVDSVLASPSMRSFFLRSNPSAIAALALLQENFSSAIDQMSVPASIIWGEDDGVAPLRTGRLLHARLNNSTLDIIRHSGHVPMNEQTTVFNKALLHRLNTHNPKRTNVERPLVSNRRGICNSQNNMHFTGNYQSISINECKGVKIENASVGKILIEESVVEINDSRVSSDGVGINIIGSRLLATALDIHASTGILTSSSRLDLAGVSINSDKEAIESASGLDSTVVVSVSRFQGAYFHGVYRLIKKQQSLTSSNY